MAVGAILYGTLTIPFNTMRVPGTDLISIRPTVAIPIFFGIVFGPVVGLVSGLLGNVISDLFSFGGIFWNWDVGNGLIGLVAGLGYLLLERADWHKRRGVIITAILAASGSVIGVGFAAMTDYVFQIGLGPLSAAIAEFWNAATTDTVNGIVLTPILLYAYYSWSRHTR